MVSLLPVPVLHYVMLCLFDFYIYVPAITTPYLPTHKHTHRRKVKFLSHTGLYLLLNLTKASVKVLAGEFKGTASWLSY